MLKSKTKRWKLILGVTVGDAMKKEGGVTSKGHRFAYL